MPSITIRSNNTKNIRLSDIRATHNANGMRILRYHIECSHVILNLHKELSASEIGILQNKADALIATWDKRYALYLAGLNKTKGKSLAEEETVQAEADRKRLRGLLKETLSVDDTVDWEALKPRDKYRKKTFPSIRPRHLPLPPARMRQK